MQLFPESQPIFRRACDAPFVGAKADGDHIALERASRHFVPIILKQKEDGVIARLLASSILLTLDPLMLMENPFINSVEYASLLIVVEL